MKIPCWSCSEPKDDQDEFCPQCGAGSAPEKHPEMVEKPDMDVPLTKPEIVEKLPKAHHKKGGIHGRS